MRDTPLRFDPALGFHLGGADIRLQARERGLAVVVLGALCHHSVGESGPARRPDQTDSSRGRGKADSRAHNRGSAEERRGAPSTAGEGENAVTTTIITPPKPGVE
jgi:hypothetical protein